jgi:hypothetical protein
MEVRKLKARRDVAIIVKTRKGFDIINTLELPISSEIKVWRKNVGWTGLYTLLDRTNGDITCSMNINGRPTDFRTTLVKPYHRDNGESDSNHSRISDHDDLQSRP